VTAVRRYLDRVRLESNRERVARTLGASSSSAAPAVGEKTGYIPKGYCVKWNKGTCTNDSCTYKHEKPPPKKDRSQSRPSSDRGRSPSRGRNDKSKKKQPCKFWKQGRCNRGTECRFSQRGSNLSPLELPLLPDPRPMTRKDPDERTAGAQGKAETALQSRRDQGVPGIAVPLRGIKVSLRHPKLPQRPFAYNSLNASIRIQCMPVATD